MYNIRAADGRIYGPADLETLRQWVQEHRILPETMLIDATTLREFPARELEGLFPMGNPEQAWAQPPAASPYPRQAVPGYTGPPAGYAEQELRTGWTYFWVGIVGIFCCAILSWIMFPLAITQANKALRLGAGQAGTLKTLSIVFLVISVAIAALGVFLQFAMGSLFTGPGW